MIIDTSFIIELLDENRDAFAKAEEISESGETCYITPVVFHELYYGALATQDEDEIRKVLNILTMYGMVDMTEQGSHRSARLLADADNNEGGDCGVGHRDAMVAGVADSLEQEILSKDDDFEKLDVEVEIFP
jgi:predicted nucleic acid-binding protein